MHVGLGKWVQEQAPFDTTRNLDVWGTDIGGVGVRTQSQWQSALAADTPSHLVQSRVSEALELRSIDFIIIRHIRPSKTSLRPSKKPVPQQAPPRRGESFMPRVDQRPWWQPGLWVSPETYAGRPLRELDMHLSENHL